jgi:hypothetical protein
LLDCQAGGPAVPRDATLLGKLFESLVTLGVRVAAESAGARVRHLRTAEGRREVDLIVVREDHRIVALEVKMSQSVGDEDVRHLRWLTEKVGSDLLDAVSGGRKRTPSRQRSFPPDYRVTASRRSYTLTLPPEPFGPLKTCARRTYCRDTNSPSSAKVSWPPRRRSIISWPKTRQ